MNEIYDKINSLRGLIKRELRKSGSSWKGFEPTEDIVEDIVQESALEAWRCLDRYDPNISSLTTWLSEIIKGRTLNWKKYYSRRASLVQEMEQTESEDPSGVAEMAEDLDERERTILDLYIGECPTQEIANILGSTEQSIQRQFSTIRQKLNGI